MPCLASVPCLATDKAARADSCGLDVPEQVEPEAFDVVTIFFSDIVGFTDISTALPAPKVMAMLDRLYRLFDGICTKYDLFKVETIGDA